MKIKECHTSAADQASADIFFSALSQFWDLSTTTALDMFARNGELTVSRYAHRVASLTTWELDSIHETALEKFSPEDMKFGCSYSNLKKVSELKAAFSTKYSLVVIDTPQGVHADYAGVSHYEHFEMLRRIEPILAKKALVVLYVNMMPYDRDKQGSHGYDEYTEYNFKDWMEARQEFYGTGSGHYVTEDQALAAYRRHFQSIGFGIDQVLLVPCYSDVPGYPPYAFRLGLALAKL